MLAPDKPFQLLAPHRISRSYIVWSRIFVRCVAGFIEIIYCMIPLDVQFSIITHSIVGILVSLWYKCFGQDHSQWKKPLHPMYKFFCHLIKHCYKIISEIKLFGQQVTPANNKENITAHVTELLWGKLTGNWQIPPPPPPPPPKGLYFEKCFHAFSAVYGSKTDRPNPVSKLATTQGETLLALPFFPVAIGIMIPVQMHNMLLT